LLDLFNKSVESGCLPSNWKKSIISMIPKKSDNKTDPKNFRPISLTSCIGKLCEKLISLRLKEFLKEKKIIINTQSGFRQSRQTKDNLIHLTQKVLETFNRKKKAFAIFFDISQAFDKVWHEGLISKLIKYEIPRYIINWIENFLRERTFVVKVNHFISNEGPIATGVPHGSVLSPLLFSIYINDIPSKYNINKYYSLLFADDLVTYFIYNKPGKVKAIIKGYLLNLEEWLNSWRLCMAANKCNCVHFQKKNSQKK
jgi:hypothetical protein